MFARSESEAVMPVVNPANGNRCASIPWGCEADVNRAVASARGAFDDERWSQSAPSFRKRVLHRLTDLIVEQAEQLDALDAEEMGKPISIMLFNAAAAAELVHFYAEAIDKACGDVYTSDEHNLMIQRRTPQSVVA